MVKNPQPKVLARLVLPQCGRRPPLGMMIGAHCSRNIVKAAVSWPHVLLEDMWCEKLNGGTFSGRKIDLRKFLSIGVPLRALAPCFKVIVSLAALLTVSVPLLFSIQSEVRASVSAKFASLIVFYLDYFNAKAIGMINSLGEVSPGKQHEISSQ